MPQANEIPFGAGFLDGAVDLRGGQGDEQEPLVAAAAILELLRSDATTPTVHLVADLLARLNGPRAFDRLLEALTYSKGANRTRLAYFARWLCTHGIQAQQVKAGLALLSVSGSSEDCPLIMRLGLLEELTLYALWALENLGDDPGAAIFELAQQVDGWGRIHAVKFLANTSDPEVKHWILHGGFVNDVWGGETAFVAATSGGLRNALETETEHEILDWAGLILVALVDDPPGEDISDYVDCVPTFSAYLAMMSNAQATPQRLSHLTTLERYLKDEAEVNPHLPEEWRTRFQLEIGEILDRPIWSELVVETLASDQLTDVKGVLTVAERLGLDPVPTIHAWLPRAPHDEYLWQEVSKRANRDEMRRLVELAEILLPFSALSTVPTNDLGLGPDYKLEGCLEMILQCLRPFPGEGWPAINAGLNCRVTRTRNMALDAFSQWPRETWPVGAAEVLARLIFLEPNVVLRNRVRELIAADS